MSSRNGAAAFAVMLLGIVSMGVLAFAGCKPKSGIVSTQAIEDAQVQFPQRGSVDFLRIAAQTLPHRLLAQTSIFPCAHLLKAAGGYGKYRAWKFKDVFNGEHTVGVAPERNKTLGAFNEVAEQADAVVIKSEVLEESTPVGRVSHYFHPVPYWVVFAVDKEKARRYRVENGATIPTCRPVKSVPIPVGSNVDQWDAYDYYRHELLSGQAEKDIVMLDTFVTVLKTLPLTGGATHVYYYMRGEEALWKTALAVGSDFALVGGLLGKSLQAMKQAPKLYRIGRVAAGSAVAIDAGLGIVAQGQAFNDLYHKRYLSAALSEGEAVIRFVSAGIIRISLKDMFKYKNAAEALAAEERAAAQGLEAEFNAAAGPAPDAVHSGTEPRLAASGTRALDEGLASRLSGDASGVVPKPGEAVSPVFDPKTEYPPVREAGETPPRVEDGPTSKVDPREENLMHDTDVGKLLPGEDLVNVPLLAAHRTGHLRFIFNNTVVESAELAMPLQVFIGKVAKPGLMFRFPKMTDEAALAFEQFLEKVSPVKPYWNCWNSICEGVLEEGLGIRVASAKGFLGRGPIFPSQGIDAMVKYGFKNAAGQPIRYTIVKTTAQTMEKFVGELRHMNFVGGAVGVIAVTLEGSVAFGGGVGLGWSIERGVEKIAKRVGLGNFHSVVIFDSTDDQ